MYCPYVITNDFEVRFLVSFDYNWDIKKKHYVVDYAFFKYNATYHEVVFINDFDLILALEKYVKRTCKNVSFRYIEFSEQ